LNEIKIPTAWMIENSRIEGYRKGIVGITIKHSLIVVNYGMPQESIGLEFSKW
jgi:UDP-N-acetylenolpyruvoylglucosamine reductase